MRKVLVTGGVRSGKSRYAESLLVEVGEVAYLTPGYPADPASDPEWAARVRNHQQRRPEHWRTVETVDLAAALTASTSPVLIDCLGTWLTRSIDRWGTWDQPFDDWHHLFNTAVEDLLNAWRNHPHPIVAVTNEVGWGVVPANPSGRLFADLLGRTNQQLATVSGDVVLMVAGRPLHL